MLKQIAKNLQLRCLQLEFKIFSALREAPIYVAAFTGYRRKFLTSNNDSVNFYFLKVFYHGGGAYA